MSLNDGAPAPIHDGYTLEGYIAGIPGVSHPISFTYRPVDPTTATRYRVRKQALFRNERMTDEDKEVAAELLDVEMAVKNVSEWDFRCMGEDESTRAPQVAVVAGLFTIYQYRRLIEIVNLGGQSDMRPADQQNDQSNDGGRTDGPTDATGDLEAAAKNSAAA